MRISPLGPLLAIGCAYEAPLDPHGPPILNAVGGTVLFAGEGEPGPTFVTAFDASDPGPPAGTGQPVTFSAVAPEAYSAGGAGLRSAPYAITHLPDGEWLLNALVDQDGDFNPLSSALAGATCGDWGGAYLSSLDPPIPGAIEVSGGTLLDDITLVVGQPFSTERPAFVFEGSPALALGALAGPLPPTVALRPATVAAAFSEELLLSLGPACAPDPEVQDCGTQPACPCDPAILEPCGTALWLWMVDSDRDGAVDPHPGEAGERGLLDIWPRIYLEHLGELGTFEHQGRLLPERWVSEAFPLGAEIGLLAVDRGLSPGEAAAGFGPIGEPIPLGRLSVTIGSVFRHYHADGVDGEDLRGPFDRVEGTPPTGDWAVTAVSFTGQTWTLPNDIGLLGLPALDPAAEPARQGQALAIVP